jgi:ectoine hydroxylase-related dioxygenase (phytanoyl-CoA dioxygenase family)
MTPEEHAFFNEHGWVIVDKLVSDERIEELRQALDDVLHRRTENAPRTHSAIERQDGTVVTQMIQAYRAHSTFEEHIYHPEIARIACELMHDPVARLWHDQVIYKGPQTGGGVGWHQDYGYWQHAAPADMVTCWLALDDCDEENGCMMMLDGSHKWGLLDDIQAFGGEELDAALDRLPDEYRKQAKMVPMKMKAGQASFHHCLTFHGSYENRSNRPRRCVISHFLNGHSRYVEAKDAHGKGKGHEVMVDDGEVISGEKFPLVFDGAPVRPHARV